MPEVPTYRLRHIRDLADLPLDKLDACLRDLQRLILSVHTMRATLGDVAPPMPEEIEWRDDGDPSATVTLGTFDGEPICAFWVQRDGPSPNPHGGG